jgi:hypothetical protein
MNVRDHLALYLDTDYVEQQHFYLSLCKTSLKISKVNQNPYIEEEQTTECNVGYEFLQINVQKNT